MKKLIHILLFLLLTACNNPGNVIIDSQRDDTVAIASKSIMADTTNETIVPLTKLTVMVLPPYDLIANAGISPYIEKYLETEISKDTSLALIKFPYKQLMNVPYQNVFDKKYCKPILDKINADIIIMSKLDQVYRSGEMITDTWNFQIRIYNTKTDKQITSTVTGNNLTDIEIKNILQDKQKRLTTEIKNNR